MKNHVKGAYSRLSRVYASLLFNRINYVHKRIEIKHKLIAGKTKSYFTYMPDIMLENPKGKSNITIMLY